MRKISRKPAKLYGVLIALLALFSVGVGVMVVDAQADAQSLIPAPGERLIIVHEGEIEKGILTQASTLRQVFTEAGIYIDPHDLVEPGLDEKLVASRYEVNIYRARPVTVVDGAIRQKVISPYQTAKQIAAHAGITLQDEDIVELDGNFDMVSGGAGIQLAITRATEFTFMLYGKKLTAYTQAKTVREMLKMKNITLGEHDTLLVPLDTPIIKGMKVELWRDGRQTITEDHDVPFAVEKIKDMDREVGYRAVKAPGILGKRTVAFEVEMLDGKELSRVEIQSTITQEPVKQVEIVGTKPSGNGLSKGKGVNTYVDSQGVAHRETYYDLPMGVVMGHCGGGTYTVRADGAKVDKGGYILIAANLSRYPRCSIVETSLGLGKVYDTGGFAAVHPHGFDLATDWTNNNGN